MTKKQKITLGVILPIAILGTTAVAVGITLSTPKISTLLLLKKNKSLYDPLKARATKIGDNLKKIEENTKKFEKEISDLQNKLNSANGNEEKSSIEKQIVEKQEQKNKNMQLHSDTQKVLAKLYAGLIRIFKPMEDAYKNIQLLKKDGLLTTQVWKQTKLICLKTYDEYNKWITTEYINLIEPKL